MLRFRFCYNRCYLPSASTMKSSPRVERVPVDPNQPSTKVPNSLTKYQIAKNFSIICIGVLGLFTAIDGLLMLQSTMNGESGIGVISQAIVYLCFCVSSLIFPKYVIKRIGIKLTYAFSMLTFIPYIAFNFYPRWSVMIPAAIIIGFGSPLLWGAQAKYLNYLSGLYADIILTEKNSQDKIGDDETGVRSRVSSILSYYGGMDNCTKDEFRMDCRCTRCERGRGASLFDDKDEDNVTMLSLTIGSASPYLTAYRFFPQKRRTQSTTSDYRTRFDSMASNIAQEILNQSYYNATKLDVSLQLSPNNDIYRNSDGDVRQSRSASYSSFKKELVPIKPNRSASYSEFKNDPEDFSAEVKPDQVCANSPFPIDVYQKKIIESTTALFFGIHGLVFMSAHFWINIMAYYVLKSGEEDNGLRSNHSCACGASFCISDTESSYCSQESMQLPSDYTRNLLTGVCVGLAIASVFVVFLFLDPVDEGDEEEVRFSLQLLSATFSLARRKELLMLMPISFNLGMTQAFFSADYNKAYVACAWGSASHVGPVAVCYGAACALSSFIAGWAVRRAGRVAVFTFASLFYYGTCVLLLLWVPDSNLPAYFFVAAAMWGTCVGIVWSQLRAFYGVLFKADEEAAFATFHMWYSLGYCMSFGYSNFLCTSLKIYLLLAISILGFVGYVIVERRHSKNKIK